MRDIFSSGHFSFLEKLGRESPADSPFRKLSFAVIALDGIWPKSGRQATIPKAEALQAVGPIMRSSFRRSDFLCLFDRADFLAVLPTADLYGSTRAAENLKRSVGRAVFSLGMETFGASVSCGVAQALESEWKDLKLAVARAAEALGFARENGGGCVGVHDGETTRMFG